jgi:hypothetical protein
MRAETRWNLSDWSEARSQMSKGDTSLNFLGDNLAIDDNLARVDGKS